MREHHALHSLLHDNSLLKSAGTPSFVWNICFKLTLTFRFFAQNAQNHQYDHIATFDEAETHANNNNVATRVSTVPFPNNLPITMKRR
jgi:hypothetical protein